MKHYKKRIVSSLVLTTLADNCTKYGKGEPLEGHRTSCTALGLTLTIKKHF